MLKLFKVILMVFMTAGEVLSDDVNQSTLLEENLLDTSSTDVFRQVDVTVQLEEVWAYTQTAAQLFCQYTISSGEDLPVTVTWKVGDGPRFATEVLKCSGYTSATKKCVFTEVLDPVYEGRVRIAEASPSMEITKVSGTDNRNFWCQVSLDYSTDVEAGFDMKSVVLRLYNAGNMPKFHSDVIDDDIVTTIGNDVTINCICASGYHCDDVFWYKGPTSTAFSDYDIIYSRTSHSRPIPTQYQAYNQWLNRAYLLGNSLVISNVTMADRGRYWCELRSVGYKAIGEWSTDAKSMMLEVRSSGGLEPFDCLGKPDGVYSDSEECSMYFECVNGAAFHRQCAQGTVFNLAPLHPYLTCDYAANVAPPCGTKIIIN